MPTQAEDTSPQTVPVWEETNPDEPAPDPKPTAPTLAELRALHASQPRPRLREGLQRTLTHGWLLPYLLTLDTFLTGRWEYWCESQQIGGLPERPIPRLDFLPAPEPAVWKMLSTCLDAIPQHGKGGWQGWSAMTYFGYFLEWLLFGFGHSGQPELPPEPAGCKGASIRLYQLFDLSAWMLWPSDYLGQILAESAYGKRQGFFPTPHTVVELMVQMAFGRTHEDTRLLSVCDPFVGTGRMLLHAGNHSLNLYGMDIDGMLCQATLVNGFLFCPWLARPLTWLTPSQHAPEHSATVSEAMAASAPSHLAEVLAETEHDTEEQWRFEPIKKRRKKKNAGEEPQIKQGLLF